MGFLMHHIFTVFSFKSMYIVDHYTWFLAFPTAYHPMLVVFPSFFLNNPIYLFSVGAWMYNLTRPPFWNKRIYKMLFIISCALMIPIALLYFGNCMAEFKWEEDEEMTVAATVSD